MGKGKGIVWANNHQGFTKDGKGNVWMLTLTPYKEIPIVKVNWGKKLKEVTDGN